MPLGLSANGKLVLAASGKLSECCCPTVTECENGAEIFVLSVEASFSRPGIGACSASETSAGGFTFDPCFPIAVTCAPGCNTEDELSFSHQVTVTQLLFDEEEETYTLSITIQEGNSCESGGATCSPITFEIGDDPLGVHAFDLGEACFVGSGNSFLVTVTITEPEE